MQPFEDARVRAKLDESTIGEIRRRLALGHIQHDIAADMGINQGRISEVNTGKLFAKGEAQPFLL